MSNTLIQNYHSVQQKINQACINACRSEASVLLLAVSKTKPVEAVMTLAEQGQIDFGENYVQEALLKIARCPSLTWHFIGPIQSNKTKRRAL